MSKFGENSAMSLSEAIKRTADDMLLAVLLNDPEKRAQVRDLLTEEGLVGYKENVSQNDNKTSKYCSPVKRVQKIDKSKINSGLKFESPSALGRRRALERLQSDSSADDISEKSSFHFVGEPKPFNSLLEGVVAYCEIRSNGEDRSMGIKTVMRTMGATVKENLCTSVTHVIFKDGLYTTYRRAKLLKVHIVSILWLDAVRKHSFRVPESKFPPVTINTSDTDISKLCQEIQQDYDEVVEEELNKVNNFNKKRLSETPQRFVNDRNSSKLRVTINGYENSEVKKAHNRTEIATPYKYRCITPALSESDSCISVGSNSNTNVDIVPNSQEGFVPVHLDKTNNLSKITEDDSHEIPDSNLGKNIKDSFDLEKASKIRSPDRVPKQIKKDISNKESSGENESIHLHLTDESNLNNSGNKSNNNIQNNSSSKNILETSLNNRNSCEDVNKLKNHCEETKSKSRNTISSNNLDIGINKNKSRRRTVGLKHSTNKEDKVNKTLDVSPKTPKRKAVISETDISVNKIQSGTKKRRQTTYLPSTEINPVRTNNVTVRKPRRKSLFAPPCNESEQQSSKTNNVCEENELISNKNSSGLSKEISNRRVRKLFDPSKSINASDINWENEPKSVQEESSEPEPKNVKYHISVQDILPKIISSKAEKNLKSMNEEKQKRKSVRALNFNSTSSESSELDHKKEAVKTSVRRSERIAQTPVKNLDNSISEENKNSSDTETTDCSVIMTTKTRKSRIIYSPECNPDEKNPKNIFNTPKTPKIRKKQIPKSSSSDEQSSTNSNRRSTLDFVPLQSKKSLEQLKMSQKQTKLVKTPSIVCTRFHKSDVQIFQRIVKKLGGFIVEDEVTKRTTHLIAGGPARTVNMLRAIARGCWVLRQEWLYKSLEASKWLDEEDFEMTEFSPAVQKCRLEKQSFGPLYSMDIFKSNGPIFISRRSTPRFSDLEELVHICSGRVVSKVEDAQIVVGEKVSQDGIICVNEKWVLDSITHNKTKKLKGYLLEWNRSS